MRAKSTTLGPDQLNECALLGHHGAFRARLRRFPAVRSRGTVLCNWNDTQFTLALKMYLEGQLNVVIDYNIASDGPSRHLPSKSPGPPTGAFFFQRLQQTGNDPSAPESCATAAAELSTTYLRRRSIFLSACCSEVRAPEGFFAADPELWKGKSR